MYRVVAVVQRRKRTTSQGCMAPMFAEKACFKGTRTQETRFAFIIL